ncbi:hypothetical protein N657DRAFT_649356 [Parathielavia appendiculata]|uniref:1-alkyl-2-acetylglycerophosphocholine esterase n=1 Tax=Parathielavia appendiculata TaxID=2587402 RepID=A0AAN6TTC9_9PEZI|nr:hypothetical protein N657DRAFT_649356 [Parathielavia appendiculata]
MQLTHLLPAAVLGAGLVQTGVFPVPDTPYRVQWTSSELVDHARPDPFNSSHPRRIMISRFTPIPARDCLQTCRVPYMTPLMASHEDAVITAFLARGNISWPRGVLASLELEVCCKVLRRSSSSSKNNNARSFGVGLKSSVPRGTVLVGTGLNTTRLMYSASAQNLAAGMGYDVVVMDHPYETDAVQFPDGSVIYGGRVPRDPNATEALAHALDVRSQDAALVLDYLGIGQGCGERVGFAGDSFGGPAAADVMLKDRRVGAGVNVDGMMFGPAVNVGVARPFLSLGSPGHNSTSDETWARFRDATTANNSRVWHKELSLAGSVHGILSDFGLIGDVAGLRDSGELVGSLFGKITGARTIEILKEYLSDFFEFALKGKGQGLLAGPSQKYPELIFV